MTETNVYFTVYSRWQFPGAGYLTQIPRDTPPQKNTAPGKGEYEYFYAPGYQEIIKIKLEFFKRYAIGIKPCPFDKGHINYR
ncbi:hypothetical protein AGMMS49991_07510 [Spirochaetia bacterium]|nr:hypothetical protein AGMMS49991_07510 [Spirochaetia bacterium]